MLGLMLSQLALRLLSAILGGYGIFCLIMSFAVPEVAAQAFTLLATAAAIVYLCGSRRTS
jgi:aconitase B